MEISSEAITQGSPGHKDNTVQPMMDPVPARHDEIGDLDTFQFEHKIFFGNDGCPGKMHVSMPRSITFKDLATAIGEELSKLGYISVDGAR